MAESTENVYVGHGNTIEEAMNAAEMAVNNASLPLGTKLTATISVEIVQGVKSDYRVQFE